MALVHEQFQVSERRACKLLGVDRSTYRYEPRPDHNADLREELVTLARQNHNEYINRYPPGLDATVWIIGSTKQTMSFKNDTKYPIMIQRIITNDGNRRWITFKGCPRGSSRCASWASSWPWTIWARATRGSRVFRGSNRSG